MAKGQRDEAVKPAPAAVGRAANAAPGRKGLFDFFGVVGRSAAAAEAFGIVSIATPSAEKSTEKQPHRHNGRSNHRERSGLPVGSRPPRQRRPRPTGERADPTPTVPYTLVSRIGPRELYRLFPKAPARTVAKIARIPKPAGCF